MKNRAQTHLMDLLAVSGVAGHEEKVAKLLREKLLQAGCKAEWIFTDDAHLRLGEGFEVGNLIVQIPGTLDQPRICFSAHMDTVPLCKGAIPIIQGDRIVSKGNTGLGGDDRAGCAAIVSAIEEMLKKSIPHPPITLLFTIAEENGLHGSGAVLFSDLGHPTMGFNLDGQDPNEIIIGAMSAARWEAKIKGKSSHAGLEPQKGISAGLIAAKALTAVSEAGFFGQIKKGEKCGTSNVGEMRGGEASNQVMDQMIVSGECRSHDPTFVEEIVTAYRTCFLDAAKNVMNDEGECGVVEFITKSDYRAFRLSESEPCVQRAIKAVETAGLKPFPMAIDAGLDANNFNEKGFPVVTLGTGSHRFHTTDEYILLNEYFKICEILLHIIQPGGAL